MNADIRCEKSTVEVVGIDTVVEDPENLRSHPDQNLAAIVASLETFGQQKPIVVDADGVVRAGNGTLAAAKVLGWQEIAIVRSELPEGEAKAYAVADNRTTDLSAFDREALAVALSQLEAEPSVLAATGFADGDLAELLTLAEELVTKGAGELEQEQPAITLSVNHVSQGDKDDIVGRINDALVGTGLRAIAY